MTFRSKLVTAPRWLLRKAGLDVVRYPSETSDVRSVLRNLRSERRTLEKENARLKLQSREGGFDSIWTNTLQTRLDNQHSNKILIYKGVAYYAQCLNYKEEIVPHSFNYVYEHVRRRIDEDFVDIEQTLNTLEPFLYCDHIGSVPAEQANETDPYWNNDFFSGADARAAYAIAAAFKPSKIVEVGSGNSTKFFRKSIREHGLSTQIVSIDPSPRAAITSLVDSVIRMSISGVNPEVFRSLSAGDILFWDGSHVACNGSDVATLFLDALPALAPGVLVHIHDIYLPFVGCDLGADLREDLRTHSHSEQLMFATYLLSATSAKVILPVHYLCSKGLLTGGGASFWFVV